MPPNASYPISLRNRSLGTNNEDDLNRSDLATLPRQMETIKELQGNEIAIDGVVYDLTDFKHPGGDSIKIFGGNDVTIQYKMIHPYHTSKHLEKMKAVGSVAKYRKE